MSEFGEARVTVVTPVFNGRDFIAETVDSVLAQAVECRAVAPFDFVIVDDGSTDGTGDFLAARYGNQVRLFRQSNRGEVAAVNRGVREASSDIVGIVNADDPIRPGLLRAVVDTLKAGTDLVAVYPDWEMIDERGVVVRTVTTFDFDLRVYLEQHLCLPGPGAFFRRSALHGEPARDSRFPLTSDYEMWLRLAMRGRIVRIPQVLATWRTHQNGASQLCRNSQMAANKVDMVMTFFEQHDVPAPMRGWRRQAFASALYCAGLLAIQDPTVPGRRYLLRSLALCPVWPGYFSAERKRSWLRILYVMCQPLSRWAYRMAVAIGLARERL